MRSNIRPINRGKGLCMRWVIVNFGTGKKLKRLDIFTKAAMEFKGMCLNKSDVMALMIIQTYQFR